MLDVACKVSSFDVHISKYRSCDTSKYIEISNVFCRPCPGIPVFVLWIYTGVYSRYWTKASMYVSNVEFVSTSIDYLVPGTAFLFIGTQKIWTVCMFTFCSKFHCISGRSGTVLQLWPIKVFFPPKYANFAHYASCAKFAKMTPKRKRILVNSREYSKAYITVMLVNTRKPISLCAKRCDFNGSEPLLYRPRFSFDVQHNYGET